MVSEPEGQQHPPHHSTPHRLLRKQRSWEGRWGFHFYHSQNSALNHGRRPWLVSVTSMRVLSVTGTGSLPQQVTEAGGGEPEHLLSHYTVITLSTQDSSIISRFYGTSNLSHGLGVIRRAFPGVTPVHLTGFSDSHHIVTNRPSGLQRSS